MKKVARTKSRIILPKILEDLKKQGLPVFEESKVRTMCLEARKVNIEVGTR